MIGRGGCDARDGAYLHMEALLVRRGAVSMRLFGVVARAGGTTASRLALFVGHPNVRTARVEVEEELDRRAADVRLGEVFGILSAVHDVLHLYARFFVPAGFARRGGVFAVLAGGALG